MQKKSPQIDILFCGLIRKKVLFKKSLNDFILLRKKRLVNQIILSTWVGELQKHPKVFEFLKKNKIKIIESTEPKENGKTYVMHQMKSLDKGLKNIKKNSFVLKTRTDVYINPLFLKKLFKNKKRLLKIKKDLPKGNIFKYKVWIPWYELKTPFYMADECFFGNSEDLKLLFNYKENYEKNYQISGGPTHIRRFLDPFLKDYPFFEDYLEKYSGEGKMAPFIRNISKNFFGLFRINIMKKMNEIRKFKNLRKKLKTNKFIECLAAYYAIIYSHFYVDSCSFKNQIVFGHVSQPKIKLDEKYLENNFSPKKSSPKYSGNVYGYDMGLLKKINKNEIIQTKFSKPFLKAVLQFYQS
jgi:hypothetical protein